MTTDRAEAEIMSDKLTDAEIIAIRKWMPLIDPTNFEHPWSETLKFADAILTSQAAVARASQPAAAVPRDVIDLMVDACVALEGFMCPDLKDERCDPESVHGRLLSWIDLNAMAAASPKEPE